MCLFSLLICKMKPQVSEKRASTWYHVLTNVQTDLPTGSAEDRICQMYKIRRAVHFSTFAPMNMQCWVFLPVCAKCKEDLAQALWFTSLNGNTNLKLIAKLFFVLFCFLHFYRVHLKRQVLISTASHTGGCCCCGADCNNTPIWVISCVLHLSFYV